MPSILITADRPADDANCSECDLAVTQDELVYWDEATDKITHAACESPKHLGIPVVEEWENDITGATLLRLGDSDRVALTWTDFVVNEWWEVLPDERLARLRLEGLKAWAIAAERGDEPEDLVDVDTFIARNG